MCAAENGRTDCVYLLVESGANTKTRDYVREMYAVLLYAILAYACLNFSNNC